MIFVVIIILVFYPIEIQLKDSEDIQLKTEILTGHLIKTIGRNLIAAFFLLTGFAIQLNNVKTVNQFFRQFLKTKLV